MEFTIEQLLQQGVSAHNEGKLQDAERLYRRILLSHPLHPNANHNLGVLAVLDGNLGIALPLFKTALDTNPNVEQFWLSYIDALAKDNQVKNAKRAIKKAKTKGIDSKKLKVLLSKPKEPSRAHLSSLSEHYQNGRYDDAEKLALYITKEFPEYRLGWKVLGAVLAQTGRNSESENAYKKAVQLAPQDAEAHNNLGATLNELGRLDEAEASCRQAISLKTDYAEAHCNLSITLKELGRLDEAEAGCRQAILLKPHFVEAHCNLGSTLKELGRLDEAEASCRQAILMKPDYAEAHNDLGIVLKEQGRLDEAEASLTQAIVLKADFPQPHYNLGLTLQELGRLDEAEASYRQAIALNSDYAESQNQLLKCLYLLDKKSLFCGQLDFLIDQDKANAIIGSLTCRSALKYGLEKSNLFCREPLKYVSHIDLSTRYDFANIFVENAKSLLADNKISSRKQSLLVNGYQTSGNLFEIENSFTEKMQKAIRLEIEKYRINFKNSEEGLIKKWPTEYSLYGWLISMKSGGELQPHIHEQGWLSGSVYINIPPKSKADSGNLVVSLGEEKDAVDTRINLGKTINVVTGSMVLFPASLMHHTIPFESEQERIVLAFDVKQK